MTWRWRLPEDRERRDPEILKKWQLGWSRKEIAEHYGITPARVSQIILSFGVREREVRPRPTRS